VQPVVIVGAGPVGLATALFLVEQGIPVRVLEAASELSQDMRASTFHPPTLDMLAPSGLAADLIGQGHKAPQWQYRQHESGERIVFDLGVLEGLTDHPFRLQCEQFRLTQAILDRLSGDDAFEMLFDAEVVAVGQDADGVAVTAVVDGEPTRFTGSYLVAADGGRSGVRKLMDLAFEGETYPRTSITVVVDHPFERRMEGILYVNYLWTADDHFSLMRVRDHWRVGFSPRPGQPLEEATSPEGVEARLQDILPAGEPYRLVHIGAYSVHRRVIDDFHHGRILFAGDAAHLNSPAGGMGMNSGVHDAHNLAGKLAAVLKGGDEALLDRYARQRRTIAVDEVQAQSDKNYKRHREKDPAVRRQIWDDLARTADDRETMRAFLRKTSMLDSLALAETIA
jgi:3-(3-hydroxy-phenyl)propionate hydroxylase